MALLIASYPDPTDPTTPITDAYAWIFEVNINLGLGTYWVSVWVHRNGGAASVVPPPPPLDRIIIHSGDVLVPAVPGDPPAEGEEIPEGGVPDKTPAVLAPSLAEVFTEAEIAKASDPTLTIWDAIKGVIYAHVALHPQLEPNTIV